MDLRLDFNDRKIQQIILILIIGIAGAGALYWYQIKPATEEIVILTAKKKEKEQELGKIKMMKPQLERLRSSVALLQVELDSLETIFPDSANIPELISNLTKVARDEEVATINFKPLGEVKKEYYTENSYEILLIGGYHNLARFFEKVARFDLIINVDNMVLKTSPTLQKDLQEYKLYEMDSYNDEIKSVSAKFRITTYSSL